MQHHDASVLLRTEHAVARVLAEASDEATAYPRLLAAIGESLGWDAGALWTRRARTRCAASRPGRGPTSSCETCRAMSLAPGEGLPGRVWASGEPAWIADVGADPNFPRGQTAVRSGPAHGVLLPDPRRVRRDRARPSSSPRERRDPDESLLATMTSLGGRIGQCVERWRAEDRLRESEARKSAILNAAFDCIITMDAGGPRRRGQPGDRADVRLRRERHGRPRPRRADHPAGAARGRTGAGSSATSPPARPHGRASGRAAGDARRRQRVPGRDRDHAAARRRARRCSPATCATSPSASATRRRCARSPPSRRRCGGSRRRWRARPTRRRCSPS